MMAAASRGTSAPKFIPKDPLREIGDAAAHAMAKAYVRESITVESLDLEVATAYVSTTSYLEANAK